MNKKESYPLKLLAIFILLWIALSINVNYREDWILENLLTVPFVIFIAWSYKKFRLSNLSYTLMFAFMTLCIIGSKYTYAEVPFGFWMQEAFGLARNHYDRIVHFSFGFLMAYPIREVFLRIANAKGFWGFYLPLDVTLSFSAIYEILEWLIAISFNPGLGTAYLGSQGDEWDGIKDMALAGLGAVIAMGTIFFINIAYNRGMWKEFKESVRIKSYKPLGEEKLREWLSSLRKGNKN